MNAMLELTQTATLPRAATALLDSGLMPAKAFPATTAMLDTTLPQRDRVHAMNVALEHIRSTPRPVAATAPLDTGLAPAKATPATIATPATMLPALDKHLATNAVREHIRQMLLQRAPIVQLGIGLASARLTRATTAAQASTLDKVKLVATTAMLARTHKLAGAHAATVVPERGLERVKVVQLVAVEV